MSSSTTRPARTVRPSGKLNKDNIAELELPSHRKFVETTQAPAPSSKSPEPEPPSSTINSADVALTPHSKPGASNPGKRRPCISDSSTSSDDVSNGDTESPTPTTSSQPKAKHPKKRKKKKKIIHGMFFIKYIVFCGDNRDTI